MYLLGAWRAQARKRANCCTASTAPWAFLSSSPSDLFSEVVNDPNTRWKKLPLFRRVRRTQAVVRAERNQTLLHPPAGIGLGLVLPRTRLSQWDRLSPGSRDCALPSYSLTLLFVSSERQKTPLQGVTPKWLTTRCSWCLLMASCRCQAPSFLLLLRAEPWSSPRCGDSCSQVVSRDKGSSFLFKMLPEAGSLEQVPLQIPGALWFDTTWMVRPCRQQCFNTNLRCPE